MKISNYKDYNKRNLPRTKVVDIFKNICRGGRTNVKFNSISEFEYWAYNIQTTYRNVNRNRKYEYRIDSTLFGNSVYDENTTVFLPLHIKELVNRLNYIITNIDEFPGTSQTAPEVYKLSITLPGYDKHINLYRDRNPSLLVVIELLLLQKHVELIADYSLKIGLLNKEITEKLVSFISDKIDMESKFGKYLMSKAKEVIYENRLFEKIISITTEYSFEVLDNITANITDNKPNDKNSYRNYLKAYVSEKDLRTKFHAISQHSKKWLSFEDFMHWFYEIQENYLETTGTARAQSPRYLYEEEFEEFIPSILKSQLHIDWSNKSATNKHGFIDKENGKYKYGVMRMIGVSEFRLPVVPDSCTDRVDIGRIVVALARKYYISLLVDELCKRDLISNNLGLRIKSFDWMHDNSNLRFSEKNIALAKDLMNEPTVVNGLRYESYYDKIKKLFNDKSLKVLDRFEENVIRY